MRRGINDYKLYVFDLDGTLYSQPRLRFVMAQRLLGYYLLHPFKAGELFMLQDFRKTKDSWKGDSDEEKLYEAVARKHGVDKQCVAGIVKKWIYENPLSAVAATKSVGLIKWMEQLKKNGKTVVILSDYPTEDKLCALNVNPDSSYSTTDPRIGELKPSPKGLTFIMEEMKFTPEETIMIGDRDEKDGECAKGAGVDFVNCRKMRKFYEEC